MPSTLHHHPVKLRILLILIILTYVEAAPRKSAENSAFEKAEKETVETINPSSADIIYNNGLVGSTLELWNKPLTETPSLHQRHLEIKIDSIPNQTNKEGDSKHNVSAINVDLRKLEPENESEESHHDVHGISVASWKWSYVKTPFIYTTFIIIAGLLKLGYHHAGFLSSIVPESCILVMLGTAVGGIVYFAGSKNVMPEFTSEAFFLFLLPPIVLESAYSLHDRAFFNNLGTILLYAVVGTIFNCFAIGPTLFGLSEVGALGNISLTLVECLVFSALISAVDPVAVLAIFQEVGVNKGLYFLVFGESLLNDAVTIVLYTMMVSFSAAEHITADQVALGFAAFLTVSLGGLCIGIVMGIITALITKHTSEVRVLEPLAMLTIAYLSYLAAEMVHFSGIISIIGCGIVQAQYARCNISQKSNITVKYFTKMVSAVCDTVIFLFLGMVLVNENHVWHTGFVLWSTVLCLLFRFIAVFSLTFLANKIKRVHKINIEEQFIMAYGGLRGAVAFSLVIMLDQKTIPNKLTFVTSTLFIVLFTVFIQGATVKPLVNLLKIRIQAGKVDSLFEEINQKVIDNVMAGVEEITGDHRGNYWSQLLLKYNSKYVKTVLQNNCSESNLTRVYTKMVLADHFAHLYGPATVIEENRPLLLYKKEAAAELPDEQVMRDEEEEKEESDEEADSKLLRKRQRPTFTLDGTPPPPSPPPLLKRNTSTSIFSSSSRKQEEDASKLLQKALQDNPYNKYHQRYNPNLVDDENQELSEQLRARHMRARRLTLAAMNSVASGEGFEGHRPGGRPESAPVFWGSMVEARKAANFFLERARMRKMGEGGHRKLVKSVSAGSTTSPKATKLERQEAFSDSLEDEKTATPAAAGTLENIAEENSPESEEDSLALDTKPGKKNMTNGHSDTPV